MQAAFLLVDAEFLKSLLPFAGVLLIVTWMMMMWRTRRRKLANRASPLERVERYQQERGMHQDLEGLMVEIEQLARRFSSQLDAKSLRLEKLIREADARIARLDDRRDAPPPEPTTSGGEDELTRSVYRLADAGHDPSAIAQQLGEHVGKVELILALRQA